MGKLIANLGLNPWVLVALVAALVASHGAVGVKSYHWGGDVARAAQKKLNDAAEADLSEVAGKLRSALIKLQNERQENEALIRDLEDQARADPDAVYRVPSANSLRRLNRRWSQD